MRALPGSNVLLLLVLWGILHTLAQQITVDTNDPAIIYNGDWYQIGLRQSHLTDTRGSSATFSFVGTTISLRSTRSASQSVEEIDLDGVKYLVDCSWPDRSVAGETVVVWSRSGLSRARHTVTFTKISAAGYSAAVWDFLYTPTTIPAAVRPVPASPSSSTLSSSTSRFQVVTTIRAVETITETLVRSPEPSAPAASSSSVPPNAQNPSSNSAPDGESAPTLTVSGQGTPVNSETEDRKVISTSQKGSLPTEESSTGSDGYSKDSSGAESPDKTDDGITDNQDGDGNDKPINDQNVPADEEGGGPSNLVKALAAVASILGMVLILTGSYLCWRRRARQRLALLNGQVYVGGSYNSLRGDDQSSMRATSILSMPFAAPRDRIRRVDTPGTLVDLISALGDDGQLPTYTPPDPGSAASLALVETSATAESRHEDISQPLGSSNASSRTLSFISAAASSRVSTEEHS